MGLMFTGCVCERCNRTFTCYEWNECFGQSKTNCGCRHTDEANRKDDWNWFAHWLCCGALVVFIIVTALVLVCLSGCGTPEQRKAAWDGVKEGFSEVPGAVVEGFTALETGGMIGGGLALLFGLYRAGAKGLAAARTAGKKRVASGPSRPRPSPRERPKGKKGVGAR